jgi:hypothetical protein
MKSIYFLIGVVVFLLYLLACEIKRYKETIEANGVINGNPTEQPPALDAKQPRK